MYSNNPITTHTYNGLFVWKHLLTSSYKIHKKSSERASSLALPHSSLLDFYDKQQEQCNSVALLPISANVVVRRHSSHYYPMLEADKQQQQQQLQHSAAVGGTGSGVMPDMDNVKSFMSSINVGLNASPFNSCNKTATNHTPSPATAAGATGTGTATFVGGATATGGGGTSSLTSQLLQQKASLFLLRGSGEGN